MFKNILGIIPARAGSKRVKNKNFRNFAGTTLTDLAIQQALSAKLLDKVVLTSDDTKAKSIGRKYTDLIVIERPKSISLDHSPAIEYQLHALQYMKKEYNQTFDLVVVIQPSSPFRSGKDIDGTIRLLKNNPHSDSAVSVTKLSHMVHPHKLKTMKGNQLIPFIKDEKEKTEAEILPQIYVRNCAVYVFKVPNIIIGVQLGSNSIGFVMPEETGIDINSNNEFRYAEYIFKKNDFS